MFGADLLMNIFGIVVALLVLSILVAVHEAGHLLMAKWSNVRVDVFSIGMGKAIWGFQYGETYYQIGRLPFGGFCGFGEEENGDSDDPDPRSLMNSPLSARLLTVIGGSLFNIIFAYLMMVMMFGVGYKEYQLSNQVYVPETIVSPADQSTIISPAYKAGLRNGDTIINIDNEEIAHFLQIPMALSLAIEENPTITYTRNQKTNTVSVRPVSDQETGLDIIGVKPLSPSAISGVMENSPAAEAGLKQKDQIITVNGMPIEFFYQLVDQIGLGQKLSLGVVREGNTNTISVNPIQKDGSWYVGIQSEYPHRITVLNKANGIGDAFVLAGEDISRTITQIVASLRKLFAGQVDVQKNISGPVRIVSITGDIAQAMDFPLLIKFMVMLSMALAVFNLLPFPGLDGGAILLQTARTIFKNNSMVEKVITGIEQFGVILLLTFAVFVLFNDVRNLVFDKPDKQTQTQSSSE